MSWATVTCGWYGKRVSRASGPGAHRRLQPLALGDAGRDHDEHHVGDRAGTCRCRTGASRTAGTRRGGRGQVVLDRRHRRGRHLGRRQQGDVRRDPRGRRVADPRPPVGQLLRPRRRDRDRDAEVDLHAAIRPVGGRLPSGPPISGRPGLGTRSRVGAARLPSPAWRRGRGAGRGCAPRRSAAPAAPAARRDHPQPGRPPPVQVEDLDRPLAVVALGRSVSMSPRTGSRPSFHIAHPAAVSYGPSGSRSPVCSNRSSRLSSPSTSAGPPGRAGAAPTSSYSSRISPISSSMRSSRVTIPSVPPYSSSTIARWCPSRRISDSAESTFLVPGSRFTSRASAADGRRPAAGHVRVEQVADVHEADHVVGVAPVDRVARVRRLPGDAGPPGTPWCRPRGSRPRCAAPSPRAPAGRRRRTRRR